MTNDLFRLAGVIFRRAPSMASQPGLRVFEEKLSIRAIE